MGKTETSDLGHSSGMLTCCRSRENYCLVLEFSGLTLVHPQQYAHPFQWPGLSMEDIAAAAAHVITDGAAVV